jgi:hypothetical protein
MSTAVFNLRYEGRRRSKSSSRLEMKAGCIQWSTDKAETKKGEREATSRCTCPLHRDGRTGMKSVVGSPTGTPPYAAKSCAVGDRLRVACQELELAGVVTREQCEVELVLLKCCSVFEFFIAN